MLIVDVYNVLQTPGVLPPRLAGMEVPELIEALARGRYRSRRMVLVCDGAGTGRTSTRAELALTGSAMELVYSGRSASADDLIEELIHRHGRTTRVTVVSTDRRIRRAARRSGAEALRSDDFLRQLIDDDARPDRAGLPAFVKDLPLDPGSVAHWLREFGYGSPDPRAVAEEMRRRRGQESAPERAAWSRTRGGKVSGTPDDPRVAPKASSRERRSPPPVDPGAGAGSPHHREAAGPQERAEKARSEEERSRKGGGDTGRGAGTRGGPQDLPDDPLLRQAIEEWRGRLDPADLDMSRWITDARPLRRRERDEPPGADA